MDVIGWLRSLGFQKYEGAFVENAIGIDVLSDLMEADLEKLGIPLGDRKRILRAIKRLGADSPSTFTAQGDIGSEQNGQTPVAAAERRHLTLMICDLVGSTALSARLDPEDMSAVMNAFHAACAQIIRSFDGYLADFQGDSILAYFGYPRAHEDDAERTVRAALEIIAAVARLETSAAEPLAVRIGIATGLVVVGDLGSLRDHGVVGDPPNLAARLQSLAEPGMVVIGASTRRLIGHLFRLRDLGQHELKGFVEPIAAWEVEGVADPESRFEAVRVAGLTHLIGRENEIDFLLKRQRVAWKGEGQIVLISGEPGIGKSRLTTALIERIADTQYTRLRYQCSPYHTNSALRPFIAQLERTSEFKADDASEQRLEKLERALAVGASRVQALAPLFAALLSIPFGDRYLPLELSPTEQRRRTMEALLEQLEGLARQRPILLMFEDTHWADATSLELIELTVERLRKLPILALFTFRQEFEPSWVRLPNVSRLALSRLDRAEVECMVMRLTDGRVLPAEVMRQIIDKTDGNPLFVEELTRAVMEGDILVEDAKGYWLDGPLPPLAIPATLHDSLMTRLDRLGSVKEICQIAAAIGREFSYSLIHALVGGEDTALQRVLARLEQADLVFRYGHAPEAIYTFKHALVRDAAYESMLKSRRHHLHGRIARVLEERFADIVETQPEIVAYHFTEAGLVDQAIEYLLKAGNLALSRSANAEAVKHLRLGIELTQSRAPSAERFRKERDFYLALGPAIAATEGHATPETLSVFLRARTLLGDNGTLTEQMTVLWGIHLAYAMGGHHTAAHETAQRCMALAEKHEHPGILALANRFMGQTLYFMGAFVDARFHLEQTLALCAANHKTITSYRKFGADDQVTALAALSRTLWILGFPDQAADSANRALERARSLGLAFTTAFALDGEALLGLFGSDLQSARAYADEGMAHSLEHSLADYEQRARFIQGALLTQSGDAPQGIELMRGAIAAIEHSKSLNRRTLYLGHYAAAHARLGQPHVGLNLLEEAVQIADTTNERFFEAELHRLRGEMLLTLGRTGDAQAGLQQALTIAKQQQARWWELRTATALAKHWHDQGKHTEAYTLLHPIYDWFAEGFGTADLQTAKALLDELRAQAPRSQVNYG